VIYPKFLLPLTLHFRFHPTSTQTITKMILLRVDFPVPP
jgi:hypothetical protein